MRLTDVVGIKVQLRQLAGAHGQRVHQALQLHLVSLAHANVCQCQHL